MDHKWVVSLLLIACAVVFFSTRSSNQATAQAPPNPADQRWVIVHSEYSYTDADAVSNYHSDVTILLDTQSGDTWMLWVGDNDQYQWERVLKNVPNLN